MRLCGRFSDPKPHPMHTRCASIALPYAGVVFQLPTACDVLVVGAGPIGLETAAVLSGEGHDVVVVDAGPVGATIARQFPPATRFFTSPERLMIRGWPLPGTTQEKTTGEEYLAYLRMFVVGAGLQVRTFTKVIGIDGVRGDFTVTTRTPDGITATIRCRTVVLATGGTSHPRRLGVPGEDLASVHTHLGDPHRFFGRRVMVVGGRNSAAESALRLYRVGAQVHLVHRAPELHPRVKHWIRPEVVSLMSEGQIVGHLPRVVTRIEPGRVTLAERAAAPQPEPAALADGRQHPTATVDVDDVLLQIGYTQDRAIFDLAGITTTGANGAPALDDATMESNVPGIYVVGTASAGTQERFEVFIENSHQHADRVAAALAGRPGPAPVPPRPLPES